MPNDGVATCFNHPRSNEEALILELGVPHPFSVGLEGIDGLTDHLSDFLVTGPEMPHGGDHALDIPGIELRTAGRRPFLRLGAGHAVDELVEIGQVFSCVREVHNLDGAVNVLLGKAPNPAGTGWIAAPVAAAVQEYCLMGAS